MSTKNNNVAVYLTPFERYDLLARQNNWVPIGLSDLERDHPIFEIRAAEHNCRKSYPALAYDLACEIAYREAMQHLREVMKCWFWTTTSAV
jgi:hypothetical protein